MLIVFLTACEPPKGVTFFYLDGGGQDFRYVLDNQTNSTVRAKIDNLLERYRSAGVTWIRLLVGPWIASNYPNPTSAEIARFNSFLAILRSGANAGKFTIELVFTQPKDGLRITEPPPYPNNKAWITAWMNGIDFTNNSVGSILIEGDLTPCEPFGGGWMCGAASTPTAASNAQWITTMLPWFVAQWPAMAQRANYELILGQDANTTDRLANNVGWAVANTPSITRIVGSLYFDLPPGSQWQAYATQTMAYLDRFAQATKRSLDRRIRHADCQARYDSRVHRE